MLEIPKVKYLLGHIFSIAISQHSCAYTIGTL